VTGRSLPVRIATLVAASAVVAGCLDVPVPSLPPTAAPTPEPTPVTTTYQLDTTVWYEGLLIHIDDVAATLDQRGGPVEVRIRFENPTADDGQLDARILLQVDPESSAAPLAPTRDSKIPTVPAKGLAGAVMTYELQGVASIDKAVILIGDPPLHVARIPVTQAGGPPELLEPVTLDLGGAPVGVAGDLRLALRGAVLRWDLPDWSQELSAQLSVITLTYDATYLGTFTGGFAFTGDNVALRLPDGTWVSPRRDGHSQSIELIGPGKTSKGLFSRFEVPSGLTGRFALIVRNGSKKKAIPFVIPG
jgi:hypothetical protein